MTDTSLTLNAPLPCTRTLGERVWQTVGFEATGLLISLPFLSFFSTQSATDDALVLGLLTCAVMIWSPAHNAVFDHVDLRLSGRVASDRPHSLRVAHAVSHELSSILITLPILIWMAGLDLYTALFVDLGLSVIYAAWAWAYFLIWDRLRPLSPHNAQGHTS